MNDTRPNLDSIVEQELAFFFSDEMRRSFLASRTPCLETVQDWSYGPESHRCWIVAADKKHQIVYCQTGFGPSFPWSCQDSGETNLGMDGQWCAYLVEAFAGMWNDKVPDDFKMMGPGERKA